MAKDLKAKCKKCRRVAEKLFLKGERCKTPKCAMVKRNYPPGFHGPKMKPRLSGYGLQLAEKQKARRQYHMMEKQFRLTFDKAGKRTGNVGENFVKMLEQRLDNVIYRLGFSSSRLSARQLVNHGHFTVNDRKMSIPSYIVKAGDVIKIKNNKKEAKIFSDINERIKQVEIPGWLGLDAKTMTAKVLHEPNMDSIKPNFNIQMIVEYYSK